jgi:solute:Na+ symporter, SSS family
VAALTGCPMYMPLIWSLFSKRQTGKIALATTVISLIITLSFKFLLPVLIDFNLSRAGEMILGVVVPAVLILIFEIILRIRKTDISEYKQLPNFGR